MGDKFAFKNVTISGLPGAGSSTLGKKLAESLSWEYFSGGDFMREYGIKNGLYDPNNAFHHDATIYDDEFDRQVDYMMRSRVSDGKGNILDAWLSGFMVQHVPVV